MVCGRAVVVEGATYVLRYYSDCLNMCVYVYVCVWANGALRFFVLQIESRILGSLFACYGTDAAEPSIRLPSVGMSSYLFAGLAICLDVCFVC